MRILAASALALVLASCGSQQPILMPTDVTIEVGKPFPDLVLPTLEDGSPASVARFRGKKTLLHVFASW